MSAAPGGPTPVQNNVYPVTVRVTGGPGNPGLAFSPDPVVLDGQPNALIVYRIATPGYHFPTDGTAIAINAADPSATFPIAWVIDAATLGLGDYNNAAGSFKYTMTVVNSRTGQRVSQDPVIKNDNQ